MDYHLGRLYLIRNYVTSEGTIFQPVEIVPYGAHQIVYGALRPHHIQIARGVREFPGRPVCFPAPNFTQTGRLGLAAMMLVLHACGGDDGSARPFGMLRISALAPNTEPSGYAVKMGVLDEEPVFAISKPLAELWRGTWFTEGWTGTTPNRDGMVQCYRKVLALYEDVLHLGHLPQWFIRERAEGANSRMMRGVAPASEPTRPWWYWRNSWGQGKKGEGNEPK